MNDAFSAHRPRFPTRLVVDQSNTFKGLWDRELRIDREQALEVFSTAALAGQRTQPC